MIVLDEQLLGRNLEVEIARWYPGAVLFVNSLRPNSVIKDDAMPALLRKQNQPTFVTINETDFWRRIPLSNQYCLVCFVLSDSRVREIPRLLRALLEHDEFKSKASRMGKAIRIADQGLLYYTVQDNTLLELK